MESRGAKLHELEIEDNRNYIVTGQILDAEVLQGKSKKYHTLPEISHKSNVIYIKLNDDGTFRELRSYCNHKCIIEIDYHKEPLGNKKYILHAHDINGKEYDFHPKARHLTEEEFEFYSRHFVGLDLKEVLR